MRRKRDHKAPWECTYTKEEQSICRPGNPPKSDKGYFEILSLCVLQSGLGWGMVRRNWPKYKKGFFDFEIEKLANAQIDDLMGKPGVIKNRRKVLAIINNAKTFKKIKEEHSSFSNFLNSLSSGSYDETIDELTHVFAHLGKYSAEYFLHSIGYQESD